MIWSATVIKNSEFGKKGTIDVLLHQKYKANGLSSSFAQPFYKICEDNLIKSIVASGEVGFGAAAMTNPCLVLSSGLGASDNTGVFSIPQVGTKGLVLEVDDDDKFSNVYYIWIGGLYGDKLYGEKVNIPRDDTDDDIGAEDNSLIVDDETDDITDSDYIKKGAYIIKTKTNEVTDYDNIDPEAVNHKNILSENTFILSKEKAGLKHNLNKDGENIGFEKIILNNDQAIFTRKIKNDDKVLEQSITMNDLETIFVLKNEDGDVENRITFKSDGGIEINTTGEMTVTAKKNLNLKTEKDMNIEAKGKISMKSDDIMNIHGKNKNLADLLDRLANEIQILKTQGAPAAQFIMPDQASKVSILRADISSNFNKNG
jgi:hypothetical protein